VERTDAVTSLLEIHAFHVENSWGKSLNFVDDSADLKQAFP